MARPGHFPHIMTTTNHKTIMIQKYQFPKLLSLVCAFTLLFSISNAALAQTGYIKFESNTDSFKVVIDYNYLEIYTVSSGDSIQVKQGLHSLRLSSPFTKDRFTRLNVLPDTTILVPYEVEESPISIENLDNNVSASLYYDATLVLLSDEDTDIYYEDNYVGTGYAMINALNGNRKVRFENKYGYKKNVSYRIQTNRIKASSEFLKPTQKMVRNTAFFPGVSQLIKRQRIKGVLLFIGTTGGVINSFIYNRKLKTANNNYNDYYALYLRTTNEAYATSFGDKLEGYANSAQKYERNRNISLGIALTFYIYNIYDGLTSKPKSGFRDEKGLDFYFSDEGITNSGMSSTATLKYNF